MYYMQDGPCEKCDFLPDFVCKMDSFEGVGGVYDF